MPADTNAGKTRDRADDAGVGASGNAGSPDAAVIVIGSSGPLAGPADPAFVGPRPPTASAIVGRRTPGDAEHPTTSTATTSLDKKRPLLDAVIGLLWNVCRLIFEEEIDSEIEAVRCPWLPESRCWSCKARALISCNTSMPRCLAIPRSSVTAALLRLL